MIFLQILAGLILIPLTLGMLLLFNIFIRHWVWHLGVSCYGLIYAGTASFMLLSGKFFIWILAAYIILYLLRSRSMALRLREKETGKAFPIVKGDIKNSKFRMAFVFPLSFLNIAKYTPSAVNRKISRESGLEIDMGKLVPLLLVKGKGTEVSVDAEGTEVYFEIQ